MKIITTSFLILFISLSLSAQTGSKKYPLFELFSNSHSSLMASKNPTFYVLLDKYAADIRHIMYYAPFPTDSCIMYQENKTEFDGRRNAYKVSVTPWVMRDASLLGLPLGKDLVLESTIISSLGKTSPIEIIVSENGSTDRTAKVTVKMIGTKPAGNYKLNVAVVEKTVLRTTTNGEMIHRNVFRTMLPNINGDTIILPDTGKEITFNYNYTPKSGWNADELYIVAFVQTLNNGNVLNVGTRFDGISSTYELLDESVLELFPNPVSNSINLNWKSELKPEKMSIYALDGSIVLTESFKTQLNLQKCATGIYYIYVEAGRYGVIKEIVKK